MSITLTTTAVMYHSSPIQGKDATSWQQGRAGKGINGSRREIGLVVFNPEQISTELAEHTLSEAKLVLTRDASYGTQAIDVSIAPALINDVSAAMTYEDCLGMAIRKLHYLTTVSDAAEIQLPGAWLHALKAGHINAFLLYRETGEGTDGYVRFTDSAQLILDIDSGYKTPVWTRSVGEGDYISGETCSHVGDLAELEYYLNIRRAAESLDPVDLDLGETAEYSDWYDMIDTLRAATNEVIAADSGPQKIKTWCTITADDLPKAEAINELRNALEEMPGGQTEQLAVRAYGRALYSYNAVDHDVNYNTINLRWQGGKQPSSGTGWQYEYPSGIGVKTKVYYHRFGYWELRKLIMVGDVPKTINNAKLRLKRTEGSNSLVLHPLLMQNIAGAIVPLNSVMDRTVTCGSVSKAVAGQTVEVVLSQEFIQKLRQSSNCWYGVGVYDKDANALYDTSATLIINYT